MLLDIFYCNIGKIKMTGSGEKADGCSFQQKSCYISVLSHAWVPSVCMLATCYHYSTGTIQLMEIPEMLSYHLALVSTTFILTLAEDWAIWNRNLSVESEQWFSIPCHFGTPNNFLGTFAGSANLSLLHVLYFLCYPLQILQPEKKK